VKKLTVILKYLVYFQLDQLLERLTKMAKLYFRYGAMGASKTANALMVEYNYHERDQRAVLMKPSVDARDGAKTIKSRVGMSKDAELIFSDTDVFKKVEKMNEEQTVDCVVIDEAQFLSPKQVDQLCKVVDEMGIPVITYGIRTDFLGELFPGSERLMAMADSIEEIKTVCWCSRKAIMNARVVDGKVVKEGEKILLGGNESYVALCRKHWAAGVLKQEGK
jgi:thymidine kinase